MSYSDEERETIVSDVLEGISDGQSLRKICVRKDIPNRATILRWLCSDDKFATSIARARETQAESVFDDITDVLADVRSGKLDATAGRTVVWGMQWQASKLKPKKYGDRQTVEHDTTDNFNDFLTKLKNG